jgi:predicted ATPase
MTSNFPAVCEPVTPRQRSASGAVVRGRAGEQRLIRDLLRRAQQGTGGVVLVDGEPGIGKSLLLRDCADEAAERGFCLVAGAADQLGQAVPLLALSPAAGEPFAAGHPGGDLPDVTAWWIIQIRAHLGGRAVLAAARLPGRIHRLAQRRLGGLSGQARRLLVTAAVLGPAFWLEDAAEMLGETPAALLPAVEEAMDAAIVTTAEQAFIFRHQLLRRAVAEMIPRPARKALHRQYGEILLARGESAARAFRKLSIASRVELTRMVVERAAGAH